VNEEAKAHWGAIAPREKNYGNAVLTALLSRTYVT